VRFVIFGVFATLVWVAYPAYSKPDGWAIAEQVFYQQFNNNQPALYTYLVSLGYKATGSFFFIIG